MDIHRPFLIIPKLILQPTWGGTYITQSKGWANGSYKDFSIGQSYELFSGSKLLTEVDDTSSQEFLPELGNPNNDHTVHNNPLFYAGKAHLTLIELVAEHKETVVGPKIWAQFQKMPLLIKLNQSKGNSYQLHVKKATADGKWLPKPESWYYFEDGLITYGLKPGTDLNAYKQTCNEIANFMQRLSQAVLSGQTDLASARNEAKKYIEKVNPSQFVNTLKVQKDEVIDLSSGGIHHSWEEDSERYPEGNIVFEVQHDVMDPVCTVRAFDQGKIKDDGSIRQVHIDDYFNNIDTDPLINDPKNAVRVKKDDNLLTTPYYSLNKYELSQEKHIDIIDSFEHIYVKTGKVTLEANGSSIVLTSGHSAYIPFSCKSYKIVPSISSIVLRTYILTK